MSENTPTPWRWDGHWLNGADRATVLWYTTKDDGTHCSPADAALIVRAVNSHAALIAALQEATYALGQTGQYPAMAQRCAAALAAAQSELQP